MSCLRNVFSRLPPGVTAGWSTRHGGVSSATYKSLNLGSHVGDDPECVAENRARLAAELGTDGVIWLNQVHGAAVVSVEGLLDQSPVADASFTTVPGLALAIMSADCVPVVVAAADASWAGAAHAGWQGLENGVIDALLDSLPSSTVAKQCIAWIGPCIRATHYPVGEEVWSRFAADYSQFVLPDSEPTKRRLDLPGMTAQQLSRRGINVFDCGVCTYASDDLFSYRRARHLGHAETGRSATIVMLTRAER